MSDTSEDPRVTIVNEHMRLENEHDFAGCIAEFGRARYEVVADKALLDGGDRVEEFLVENKTAPTSGSCLLESRPPRDAWLSRDGSPALTWATGVVYRPRDARSISPCA